MKALGYLLITTVKNRLLSLRKKPALLILYGILALSIVLMIISYMKTDYMKLPNTDSYADIRILYAIVAGLGLLFLFTQVTTGLSTGSTLFNMADVGLLFVSPVSPKKILVYGLIKQMGTTLLTSLFILFQVSTIKRFFGLDIGIIIGLLVIYAVILFYCQIISIGVYIFTNGNPKRKKLIKGILYGLFVLIAAVIFLIRAQNGGTIIASVLSLMDLTPFYCLPVAGWAILFAKACIEANMLYLIVSVALFAVTAVIMVTLFTTGNTDYYEDVLTSTETVYRRVQDAREGKQVFSSTRKIKVKERQTGIRYGKGYLAIFFKHMLEKRRTSRLIFLDAYTVIAAVGSGILCKNMNNEVSVYVVLGTLVYIQFFMAAFGRLSMELTKPYIYMIPEKSVKKVLAASITTLIKPCIDAVIIFTVVCIVSKTSPLLNLFLALAYASSGAIFVSYTLLCQRIFGGQLNQILSKMLGLSLFMAVVAPGVTASVAAVLLLPEQLTFLGTLPFTFCCVVISIFTFTVCGDLLDKAEYSGK